jgi:MFS family permease
MTVGLPPGSSRAMDGEDGASTRPLNALAAMLLVQAMVTMALVSASVLAPAVAPALGLPPERIGLYAGLAYLSAMIVGLVSGHAVHRVGAIRLSRLALVAAAVGALIAAAAPAAAPGAVLLLAALAIGLGYGVTNPAAAAVMTHHAPLRARGLFFSVKQAGVPIGVALAGLAMPLGLAWLGWRGAAVGLAAGCLALAAALGPWGHRLEPPPTSPPAGGVVLLMRRVWREALLRRLGLASLAYAWTQQVFVTFIVSLLNLRLGWTLVAAAGLLSMSQLVATLARIGFGALSDRLVAPGRLLVGLGLAMSACCVALGALAGAAGESGAASEWLLSAAALVCAATAMGWNGVFFAELALRVPRQEIVQVSGATQFLTFMGGMLGPLLFGEALRAGLSWAMAWLLVALVPLAAAVSLARAAPPARH